MDSHREHLGSIPDVGPMPSMPFAVTYSGEQPGSAAGFAVIPPYCAWKARISVAAAGFLAVLSLCLKAISASVGRKSGVHSAFPKARAYSRHAGLSPQSGSGRNFLLYGEPARPSFGSARDADRDIARRGSPGARRRTLSHRRLGCPSRSHALPVDLAAGRCRLPRSVASNQNWICKGLPAGEPRSPVMTRRGERGIWQRRYWEHTIRDDRDFAAHMDYTHFNPVKHGPVENPADWPYSSFRRCMEGGLCPDGLRGGGSEPQETGE